MSFGFIILSSHLLSAAEFGELRFMMTMLPLLMAFSLPGFDAVILRDSNLGLKIPLFKIFRLRFLCALIGSALLIVLIVFSIDDLSNSLLFFFFVTVLLLPLFETATGYKNFLIGRGLVKQSVNLHFLNRIANIVLFFVFAAGLLFTGVSPFWLYPAFLVSVALPTVIISLQVLLQHDGYRIVFRKQSGKVNLQGAVLASTAGLVFTLVYSFDKLWLRGLGGAEILAAYAVLVMIPQELAKLFDMTVPLFYKKLFFQGQSTAAAKLNPSLLFGAVAVLFVLVYTPFFYLFSPWIFGVFYQFEVSEVFVSGLLFGGQALEFYFGHKIFAGYGARAQLVCSFVNLFFGGMAVVVGFMVGDVYGLIIALFIKQLLLYPSLVFLYQRQQV